MKQFVLAVAIVLLTGMGCTVEAPQEQRVKFADGLLELQFPAGWYSNKKEHPFDLQYFSPKQRMNTGVFLYTTEDLAADSTPLAILEVHVEDIQSKRENFTLIEPNETERLGDTTLTTAVYAVDASALRNYYKFTLIEFAENPQFLVVLQVAIPSEWSRSKPVLEKITRSARVSSARP